MKFLISDILYPSFGANVIMYDCGGFLSHIVIPFFDPYCVSQSLSKNNHTMNGEEQLDWLDKKQKIFQFQIELSQTHHEQE